MGWITRDFRCDDCGFEHHEIVRTPFPLGKALKEPCSQCGGASVRATIGATATTLAITPGSEAHEAAVESRARAHDKIVHREYWDKKGMRVPKRFQ